MSILTRTSTWRFFTALILVIISCFLLSEVFAKSNRTRTIRKTSSAQITPAAPNAPMTIAPSGGTLTDSSGPIVFTGGPYLVPNPSSQATGTPTCDAVLICDTYTLTVSGLSSATTASKYIRVEVRWPELTEAQFDLYVFQGTTTTGTPYAASIGNQTYVDPDAVLIPAINVT